MRDHVGDDELDWERIAVMVYGESSFVVIFVRWVVVRVGSSCELVSGRC
jgi:hypothetical protein